jgi:hypothetical protein
MWQRHVLGGHGHRVRGQRSSQRAPPYLSVSQREEKEEELKNWSLRDTVLKYADLPAIAGRKFWLSRLTTASSELYSPETETNAIRTARSHHQKDKVMPLQYCLEYSVSLKVGSRYFGSFKGIV